MIHGAYAFISEEQFLKSSASGGAFMAIVKEAFDKYKDCAVYGVTLDDNLNAKHCRAASLAECKKFQGSKYIGSTVAEIYEQLEEDLLAGRHVIFSGLPCQVFALKARLAKKNIPVEKLLLIDIMCHGTPKQELWETYKKWLEGKYKSRLEDYSFRYKPAKWQNYPAMARFENGKTIVNSQEVRIFNRVFLSGYIMREACYSCQFASTERQGDITLADFWGIHQVMPEFPRDNGVSLIITSSDKGDEMIELLKKDEVNTIKESPNDDYIKYQHNMSEPTKKPVSYETFWETYKNNGFEACVKKYAGYNIKGKCAFKAKKLLNEAGIVKLIRKH